VGAEWEWRGGLGCAVGFYFEGGRSMACRSVWARWGPWRGSGWGRGAVERVQRVQGVHWSARNRGEAAAPFLIDGQSFC
jgi:hypothetical protein